MQDEGGEDNTQQALANPQGPSGNWNFTEGAVDDSDSEGMEPLEWSASEFIAHEKSGGWYMMLVAGTLVVAGISFFLAREIFTPILIGFTGILFGIIAARKPRELKYGVDEKGIYVGEKFYSFADFKSFSVVREGAIESIWFTPLKRLTPSLTIYFAPDDGSRIVDAVSQFLPVEEKQLDAIDRLMHRIGF